MLRSVTFHLGLHCLQKYMFRGFQSIATIWLKRFIECADEIQCLSSDSLASNEAWADLDLQCLK